MARAGKDVSEKSILKMRRRKLPGIAFFLILLILLYLVILIWNYFSKNHVSIYEVNTSDISDDSPLFAYVLREEEVVKSSDSGYINYYIPEGSRIGKGDVVYTLDDNDSLRSMLTSIRSESTQQAQIAPVREEISTFYNSFSKSDYAAVGDFHFAINNVILEHSRGNLFRVLKKQIKADGADTSFRKYKAVKSGVVSYYTDGYETLPESDITADVLGMNKTVERKQVASSGQISSNDPVYKLVTSNDWALIAELDDSYYESLKDLNFVRIKIVKDSISFNAAITHIDSGSHHLVKLETSRYMERYINDRFLRIEFNLRQASGLKIPNSSIIKKEYYEVPKGFVNSSNGKMTVIRQYLDEENQTAYENIEIVSRYYNDDSEFIRDPRLKPGDILLSSDGTLFTLSESTVMEGVYSVNEGFCRFKPVDILYQNLEYSIISDTTRDGLKSFDHIVVDPTDLNDDDFID